ncbi:Pleckstrin y domain-containing family J member 1 [Chionoecetes opilio]|uniref:Pleckstrin homology domain-containing family J member 1 n=1 Tax=Chionoecetes opilio TaxID=41210 RepID=A0A8J4XWJ7_CHIOP|nr:Pleckstrin y domain-containing family J member 1 [Chionoecetes opilio]
MHFNSEGLAHFAEGVGDHESRLTHKSPPRTLYDSAYKERWFKLKANLLFYYRLNEFGGVEKNEPSGVFVLENVDVQKEDCDVPFGFAIRWKAWELTVFRKAQVRWMTVGFYSKVLSGGAAGAATSSTTAWELTVFRKAQDDMERKHLFFAQSEASAFTWVNKLIHASYEHIRAQMVMLRVQIRRKTGKDPLEHLGTPLIQRMSRRKAQSKSQFHVNLEEHHLPQELPRGSVLESSSPIAHHSSERRSPSRYSLSLSPNMKAKVQSKSSMREPVRTAPIPPPRRAKKQNAENGPLIVEDLVLRGGGGCQTVDDLVPGVGRNRATFTCHIEDECVSKKQDHLLD